MRLLTKRATISHRARITLGGTDILALPDAEMRKLRGNDMTMIFQEPMSSLNPVYTVGQQLVEVAPPAQPDSRAEAQERAQKLLEEVQIPEPRRGSGSIRTRCPVASASG